MLGYRSYRGSWPEEVEWSGKFDIDSEPCDQDRPRSVEIAEAILFGSQERWNPFGTGGNISQLVIGKKNFL